MSYADVALASAFQSDIEIKMEPRLIETQSQINLAMGETRAVTVTVLPQGAGANRRIRAFSSGPLFVDVVNEEVTTNADGTATFHIRGELSGAADIMFALEGTQVRGATHVTVALPGEPAQTAISRRAITVTANTGGIARADRPLAASGNTITVTLTPHNGFELGGISATDATGAAVDLFGSGDTRAFTMPASAVSINVLFRESDGEADPVSVTGVTLNHSSLTIAQGRQGHLAAIIEPVNATNRNVIWSTSNASVVTVNNGLVTAYAAGTATITVTTLDGNHTAYGVVTVTAASTDNNDGGGGSVDNRQAYFENRFPGREVIILPDGGALGEANGNTVIVSGSGDDWIEMTGGGNIFVYERGGGHDTVTSNNTDINNRNEIHFGPGITRGDLSFTRYEDDLRINITGQEPGSITVRNWYVTEEHRLRMFLYDGTEVTVTYETSENAGGGGCNVAGYAFAMWLALLLLILKGKKR